MIRELRTEIAKLQAQLTAGGPAVERTASSEAAREPDETAAAQLAENKRLMAELAETRAEKEVRMLARIIRYSVSWD